MCLCIKGVNMFFPTARLNSIYSSILSVKLFKASRSKVLQMHTFYRQIVHSAAALDKPFKIYLKSFSQQTRNSQQRQDRPILHCISKELVVQVIKSLFFHLIIWYRSTCKSSIYQNTTIAQLDALQVLLSLQSTDSKVLNPTDVGLQQQDASSCKTCMYYLSSMAQWIKAHP